MATMQLKLPQMPFKTLSLSTVLLQCFCTFIQTDHGLLCHCLCQDSSFLECYFSVPATGKLPLLLQEMIQGHLSKISPEFCLKNINYCFLLWILESLFLFLSLWSFNSTWFGTFMATQGEETHFMIFLFVRTVRVL